jgi:hypothetical protein
MSARALGRTHVVPPLPSAALAAALVLAASLASLTSCSRTPRLVPAGADSTAAIPADSTALYVQMARDRWQSPDDTGEAADLTARLILDRMRGDRDQTLGSAAREFVDSLGMGAEVQGRDPAVVNLFSRSDPSGGSWPFLFWHDGQTVHYQRLDADGMHLGGVSVEPAAADKAQRIAAVFVGSGPAGQQPFAFVWVRPPNAASWRLTQSLGADSLGKTGNARILERSPDGAVLETRTYTIERGFDECPSCPHVYRLRRFRWDTSGLVSIGSGVEHTPYATFVQLIAALAAGDRAAAAPLVADGALLSAADGYGFGTGKGRWRLAPGMTATSTELLVLRGSQEAYRVHFAPRGDDWVITGFEPTSRNVE